MREYKDLTTDEKLSLMRTKTPTAWNKYNKIVIEGDSVYCYYLKLFTINDYGDREVDAETDTLTLDERYKMCGFRDYKHYEECILAYNTRKGVPAY